MGMGEVGGGLRGCDGDAQDRAHNAAELEDLIHKALQNPKLLTPSALPGAQREAKLDSVSDGVTCCEQELSKEDCPACTCHFSLALTCRAAQTSWSAAR